MAISFYPDAGTVLVCDFHGFIFPEMLKRRPVVVVSPRSRSGTRQCTIVPISTTAPPKQMPWHIQHQFTDPLPAYPELNVWIKADMVYTVSFDRLFGFKDGKNQDGSRMYVPVNVGEVRLSEIRTAIQHALGILT